MPIFQPALTLLPLALLLAACATPRENCLSDATRSLRINDQLIAQTEANLSRGYGIETRQDVREVRRTCRGVTESGEQVRTRCPDVIIRDVSVPVALDLRMERAKLASLRAQRVELQARSAARAQQCQALYPA